MGSNRRLFEPDSQVAFRLDYELGYRDSAETEWRFVSLEDLSDRPSRFRPQIARLHELVPAGVAVPTLEITPGPDPGEVRLTSAVNISVHPYGDTCANLAGRVVDVPFGSVVRVGPLLVAPLYQEQVESVQDGLLTLPTIGAVGNMVESDQEDAEPPKSRRWALKLWGAAWLSAFVASAFGGLAACVVSYHSYYDHAAMVPTIIVFLVGLFWFWLVVTGVPVHRIVSDWVQAPTMDPDGLGNRSRRLRVITLGTWCLMWIGAFVAVVALVLIDFQYEYAYTGWSRESFVAMLGEIIPRWVVILLLGTPVHLVMSLVVSKIRDSSSLPAPT